MLVDRIIRKHQSLCVTKFHIRIFIIQSKSFLHRANRGFQIAISKANPTQQQPTGNIIRLIMQSSAQCQRQIIHLFVTEFRLWRHEFF
ncbi:Uncharacterised protein [Vibrio cholerae]|nr:Uncharacterised protein [Vibrio cholerae]CSI46819.1 Uncharacterised protein [Vibrio cholerae]